MIQEIEKARLIPVIAIPRAEDIVPLGEALRAGGLRVAEITFRTEAGRRAIEIAAKELPDFLLGAGTVTTIEELEAAKAAGASFAVAPGTNPRIIRRAEEIGLPFFPGVCTPSDIEAAMECGARLLKFFPAEAMGGVETVRALHAPYKHRGIRFVPTGGITRDNMASYLSDPAVAAVGGSWFVAAGLLENRQWDHVAELTAAAVASIPSV